MTRPAPGTRADYRAFRTLPTRWMDNDEYGHMNNATYLSLFDTAISLWQMENGIPIRGPNAMRLLVVETGCRYHAEAGFPDTIHAGLRLGHIGTSSMRTEIGLFRNDENTACTEGFFTQVLTGAQGRPAPLPLPLRETLQALLP
ncbi:acyl-CoA thioesterase [Antarctobacter sp.]|uniref:acyl-CoA thioesterase n=1 Tax=Antarctobacter sp. TaxID=1872577 RepID=UPI002B26D813|nr:acyl-CoA thioesterase [Antarctobacter sp.]